MWDRLWTDFNDRTERLLAGQTGRAHLGNAIDDTILWQIHGNMCQVPTPIAPNSLHLPELYSGAPWVKDNPWIAFVTLNPSINPQEIFPTREHFMEYRARNEMSKLAKYFNERFDSPLNDEPMRHGRRPFPDNVQKLTVWTGNQEHPIPHGQPTWGRIETSLHRCLSETRWAHYSGLLGTIAAITDAVPWKFAHWACLPNGVKAQLLVEGSEYLADTLWANGHPPNLIITCGAELRRAALPVGHCLAGAADEVNIHGIAVPRLEFNAPTAPPPRNRPQMTFANQMAAHLLEVRRALQV